MCINCQSLINKIEYNAMNLNAVTQMFRYSLQGDGSNSDNSDQEMESQSDARQDSFEGMTSSAGVREIQFCFPVQLLFEIITVFRLYFKLATEFCNSVQTVSLCRQFCLITKCLYDGCIAVSKLFHRFIRHQSRSLG